MRLARLSAERMASFAWAGFLCAALAFSAWGHVQAGLTLPIPWEDETSWLCPAIRFAQSGTLFAPELNPDRTLFWQPPGYFIGMALFVKMFGAGLEAARWVSWAFMASSLGLLALFLRRFPRGGLAFFFLSLCWLDSPLVCIGNIARMEGPLLFLACAGYLLCAQNRWWKGLAVLALGGLVHFNGVYFFCGAAAAWLLQPSEWKRPARSDLLVLLPVGILWLGYAVYVGCNWNWFAADMAEQFARKSDRGLLANALSWPWIGYEILYLAAAATAWAKWRRGLLVVAFGAACLALYVVGQEMWYVPFQFVGIVIALWLAVAGIHALLRSIRALPRWIPGGFYGVALPAMLVHLYFQGIVEDPRGYPRDLAWGWGMRAADSVEYATADDLDRVVRALRQALPDHEPIFLGFDPPGDQMLYTGRLPGHVRPLFPLFTGKRPDFILVHRSKYVPDWIARHKDSISAGAAPLHSRDGGEEWHLLRVSAR